MRREAIGKVKVLGTAVAVAVAFGAQSARADGILQNVILALSETGFNVVGERNFLSGGADLTVSRQFNGETLDFGATELTLQGTPVFTFSTGGRGLQVLDLSLNTNNNPINYTFVTDTGNQTTTVTGSFFGDINVSLNSFGYYDLQMDLSSRQTIDQDGRFVTDVTEQDFDIGPINIEGNIFADLLAVVTDPIFRLLGVDNIFAQFSGAAQFEAKMAAMASDAAAKARAGLPLTADEIMELGAASRMRATAEAIPDFSYVDPSMLPDGLRGQGDSPVGGAMHLPEPSTVMLLLLAGPAILARRGRMR